MTEEQLKLTLISILNSMEMEKTKPLPSILHAEYIAAIVRLFDSYHADLQKEKDIAKAFDVMELTIKINQILKP